MIISPDNFLIEDGIYNWSPERANFAWEQSYQLLQFAANSNEYFKFVLISGLPNSGKSTWLSNNHKDDTVYFDATLTKRGVRQKILKYIPETWHKSIIVICCPIEICKIRNAARPEDKRVPETTIERMNNNFLLPMTKNNPNIKEEGVDQILFIETHE